MSNPYNYGRESAHQGPLAPETALRKLRELFNVDGQFPLREDEEELHAEAEEILLAVLRHYGHEEIAVLFEEHRAFWWYA